MDNATSITVTGPSIKRGKSKQNYATPGDFRAAVSQRFGTPIFDLAAEKDTYFASSVDFYTKQENSLVRSWAQHYGLLWLNPPFDHIEPWAAKCRFEMERGARILFLTPASVGSVWFANHVRGHAMVFGLTPRLCFDGVAPYPKDCILSVFWGGVHGFDVWKWK